MKDTQRLVVVLGVAFGAFAIALGSSVRRRRRLTEGKRQQACNNNNDDDDDGVCGVFWDYENVRVYENVAAALASNRIRECLRRLRCGRVVAKRLYCDCSTVSGITEKHRGPMDLAGWTLCDAPTRKTKETVDKKIIVDAMAFASLNNHHHRRSKLKSPLTVVLITGDGDYSYMLHTMRDWGMRTVVIFPDGQTASCLLDAADVALNWTHQVLARDDAAVEEDEAEEEKWGMCPHLRRRTQCHDCLAQAKRSPPKKAAKSKSKIDRKKRKVRAAAVAAQASMVATKSNQFGLDGQILLEAVRSALHEAEDSLPGPTLFDSGSKGGVVLPKGMTHAEARALINGDSRFRVYFDGHVYVYALDENQADEEDEEEKKKTIGGSAPLFPAAASAASPTGVASFAFTRQRSDEWARKQAGSSSDMSEDAVRAEVRKRFGELTDDSGGSSGEDPIFTCVNCGWSVRSTEELAEHVAFCFAPSSLPQPLLPAGGAISTDMSDIVSEAEEGRFQTFLHAVASSLNPRSSAGEDGWLVDATIAAAWYPTQGGRATARAKVAYKALRVSAFAGGLVQIGFVDKQSGAIRPIQVGARDDLATLRRPNWACMRRMQMYVRLTDEGRKLLNG